MSEFLETGPSALTSYLSSGYIPDAELLVDSVPVEGRLGFGVWPSDYKDENINSVHLTREQASKLVQHLTQLLEDWE